jgi:precorrin-6B methylase 2
MGGLFHGLRMDVDFRSGTQTYLGLWERETAPWVRRLSEDARTALDVGAKHGYYALFFAKRTRARVIAFDPDEEAARLFERSLALNPAEAGRVSFRPEKIGPVALDSLLPLDFPVVVKMDIEGAEGRALRTATQLLRGDTRWIIEIHSPQLEQECLEILRNAGLETKVIRFAWWRAIVPEKRLISQSWIVAARRL